MVQSLGIQRLRPSKRDQVRAFRGARFGAARSAMIWRYALGPGILLPTFIYYGHVMAKAAAHAGVEYPGFIQRTVDAAVDGYERA